MAFGDEGFLDLIEAWDGNNVAVHFDAPTGAWIFVAMHDDRLGPSVGGCRMMVYPRPEEALRDALRLSAGMTAKWAAIDFPFGGGKAVIAVPTIPEGEVRAGLMERFGDVLNSLKGAYGTGEDLGTTPEDMQRVATVSQHVIGVHGIEGGPTDPGPFTALGVYECIKAALAYRTGSSDPAGRRILIQGVGDVGGPLAQLVADAGAHALLTDLDQDLAFALSVELGGSFVPPEDVYGIECDVYAPCAVGATLNPSTIPRLRCGMVVGSANNQLESDDDAERLANLGILYAPDFVVNAGGAMAFGMVYLGERSPAVLDRRVQTLGALLTEIFEEAEELGASPLVAARRRVDRVLKRTTKS